MSTIASSIVHGLPFNQLTQRRTLQSILSTITHMSMDKNPFASLQTLNVYASQNQKPNWYIDDQGRRIPVLNRDNSSQDVHDYQDGTIKAVEVNKTYNKGEKFGYQGVIFEVIEDTISFDNALNGTIEAAIFDRKIVSSSTSYKEVDDNSKINEIEFYSQLLYGEARPRKTYMKATMEAIEDMVAYAQQSTNSASAEQIMLSATVEPLLNDISREAAAKLFSIARKAPEFDLGINNLASDEFNRTRALYARINEISQQLYLETTRRGNVVLCSPKVLGRLSTLDTFASLEDEQGELIPNHFVDERGIVFTSSDFMNGAIDYAIILVNDEGEEDNAPMAALYSYLMMVDGGEEDTPVYVQEAIDPKTFAPTYLSGARYSLMVNTDQVSDEKVIDADAAFKSMIGKSQYAIMIPVV